MLKNFIILLIAFYILTFSAKVFAGGFYTGSRNFAFKPNMFYRYNSKYTNQSFAKHKPKFNRRWHHKTKCTNKIYFPYYVYDPYYTSFGKEEDSYVEINIINNKKDKKTEPSVHKDRTFSPPRIVNLEDLAPNKSENVILIHGTKVVETKISSD
jgi:hypothetical protein